MIKDKLIPRLKEAFPNMSMLYSEAGNPIATIQAAHPEVGDVLIYDDEDEATVFIGDITHNHYNPYDETLSREEVDDVVSAEVIEFLEALFRDEILMWKTDMGGGGSTRIQYEENIDKLVDNNKAFVWSGPIGINDLNAG